jgi:hypothetical protein
MLFIKWGRWGRWNKNAEIEPYPDRIIFGTYSHLFNVVEKVKLK